MGIAIAMVHLARRCILAAFVVGIQQVRCAVDVFGGLRNILKKEPDMLLAKSRRNQKCDMSGGKQCGFTELDAEKPSLIFPGGKTSCLEGGRYAFRVYPGETDLLYLH